MPATAVTAEGKNVTASKFEAIQGGRGLGQWMDTGSGEQ